MKKLISVLLILVLLCGCADNGAEGEKKVSIREGKTLYLTGYNFDSSNPLDTKNTVNRDVFSLVYDSLYKTSDNGSPYPVLAERAVCSADNLSWEITLKNNISFHNGEPFSSKDVVATINYLLTNETIYKNNIKNISSVRAASAYSVIISLNYPAVNFPAQLTFPVISESGFGPDGFNGTGNFKVKEYVKMKKLVLEAKEAYIKDKYSISSVEVSLVSDKDTAEFANQSGLSDVYVFETLHSESSDLSKNGIKAKDYISNTFGFLLLNNDRLMFKDVNVRKAISLSVNRNEIVENLLFSKAVATSTPIRPDYYLSVPDKEIEYSTDKAKELLSENGYVGDISTGVFEKDVTYEILPEDEEINPEDTVPTVTSKVKVSFEILVNSENTFRLQIANAIAGSLKYAGIEAKVKAVSFEEYQTAYAEGNYDALLASVIIPEDNDLTQFVSENGFTRFPGGEGLKIINDIASSPEEDKKREYYHGLYDYFSEKQPLISLYFEKMSLMYSKRISGNLSPTAFCVFNKIEEWKIKNQ